jgi:hypothetical protein
VGRPPDPVAQLREGENRPEHFGLERRADVRIHRRAAAENPAEIEHLDRIPHGDVARHHAGVAAEGATGAQHAGHHVAGPERQHPPRSVLDRVVRRLVLEDAHRQHVALRRDDLVAHDHFGRERGVSGRAADAVEPDSAGDDH